MSKTDHLGSFRFLSPLLLPLSWVYCIGLKIYLLPYWLGIRKQHMLSCRVVCIGNLTYGGTGKTPAVITLVKTICDRGLKVVVLSRGHGGRLSGQSAVVSDGTGRKMDWKDCGDEPALIADSLPGIPVVIGKNRVKAGKMAVELFHPDIIVMDDGMQYWQLHKDMVVALASAKDPFGSGGVLPLGTLREPKSGLRRSSAVLITGVDQVDTRVLEKAKGSLLKVHPKGEFYMGRHIPTSLYKASDGSNMALNTLKGMDVAALSSIGSPGSFEHTLEAMGARIAKTLRYPDHYNYTDEDIRSITDGCRGLEIVTTEKDMVRLKKQRFSRALVLSVKMEIDDAERLVDNICGDILR